MATKVSDALLSTVNTGFATEKATADKSSNELGQDAFLTMMLTQMKNQDPTKPMDSAQYLAQLAQFSTVSGIEKLNTTIQGFIGQLQTSGAMQAAGLVGRQVVEIFQRTRHEPGDELLRLRDGQRVRVVAAHAGGDLGQGRISRAHGRRW